MHTSLSAFEELFRTHGPRMKSLAYHLLGNTSDAEDAVQEAFLKACRSQAEFRGGSTLWTWVYRILVNTCRDVGRQRAVSRIDPAVDVTDATHLALPAGDHPLRVTLERLVERLPARAREVFLLHELEGLTHREIAGVLGVAEGTSKAALFEARRQMAAKLRERQPLAQRSGT